MVFPPSRWVMIMTITMMITMMMLTMMMIIVIIVTDDHDDHDDHDDDYDDDDDDDDDPDHRDDDHDDHDDHDDDDYDLPELLQVIGSSGSAELVKWEGCDDLQRHLPPTGTGSSAPLGALVAAALRAHTTSTAAAAAGSSGPWADFGMVNGGGLRADLPGVGGDITWGTVDALWPCDAALTFTAFI